MVAGALAGAAAPARGQHRLARVGLVQQDEVALLQAQEQRRRRVTCKKEDIDVEVLLKYVNPGASLN